MKRATLFIVSAVVILGCLIPLSADETAQALMKLYRRKRDFGQKYEIMQDLVERDDPSIGPFLIESLDELNQQDTLRDRKRTEVKKDLAVLVVGQIGDRKVQGAETVLFRAVLEAQDPHLKSEAILSLGKVGARSYAGRIAMILRDVNTYRGEDAVRSEVIAFGCIRALEMLRDPVGYLPVYTALSAGYSRKIKEAAQAALANMVDDPAETLNSLVQKDPSLRLKIDGLKAAESSNASPEKKITVVATALRMGFTWKPADQEEEGLLRELRVEALYACVRLGYPNAETTDLVERILYDNVEDSEKVLAIGALKSMGDERSFEAVSRFLGYQNDRQESGMRAQDNKLVIETIRALAASKSGVGYDELLRAKYSGYTAAVVREVESALSMMKK